MNERQQLARYQAELLEILYSEAPIDEVADSFRRLAAKSGYPDLPAAELRMLATAMELTRRWGVKDDSGADHGS